MKAKRCLTKNDEDLLRKTIGKKIVSLKIGDKDSISYPVLDVWLNFENDSPLKIRNDEEPVSDFDGSIEEMVGFGCEALGSAGDDAFKRGYIDYRVPSSVIKEIEIVTDDITISFEEYEDYHIVFDAGIILHGDKHDYVFALDIPLFFPGIHYSTDAKIEDFRPIDEVKKYWADSEGAIGVTVSRFSRTL